MAIRNIVKINEKRCNGCGQCVSACAEGAIAIIDGKARVVSETYCDGLGACLGKCPMDAITIEQREAPAFDEHAAMAHVARLQETTAEGSCATQKPDLPCGCPGTMARKLSPAGAGKGNVVANTATTAPKSELGQWPVQLALLNPRAPYFEDAHLLVSADCVAFALGDFHQRLLAGKAVAIACPKLDDVKPYVQKLAEIFRVNRIQSVTVAHMEVPCCTGIVRVVQEALRQSGAAVPMHDITVGIDGQVQQET